ncbi:MAG TPA: hypothetical protein VJY86_00005 [Bacilli bacterium]|nr:hypothetical protein [Bacilli bacterium]
MVKKCGIQLISIVALSSNVTPLKKEEDTCLKIITTEAKILY